MKRKKYEHLLKVDTSKMDYRTWLTYVDIYANAITKQKKFFSNFYNADTLLNVDFAEYSKKRKELHENQEKLIKLLSYGKTRLFQLPDFLVKMYDKSVKQIFSKHNDFVKLRRNELRYMSDYCDDDNYKDDDFGHDDFDNDF